MNLTTKSIFRHDPTQQTPRVTQLSRFLGLPGSFFPRTPLFPALRSGHRLFKRPSTPKKIPIVMIGERDGTARKSDTLKIKMLPGGGFLRRFVK